MNIGRGYIFYNQTILDDETWEDTLKRENLIIVQVGREVDKKFNVNIYRILDGTLVSKNDILTKKEIEELIK